MVDTSVSRYLKAKLRESGLSQTEFAKKVGVSKQAVGKWLRGGTIENKRLAKVAEVLRADLDELARLHFDAGAGPLQADHIRPFHHEQKVRGPHDGIVVLTQQEHNMLGKFRKLDTTEQIMFDWLLQICISSPKTNRYTAYERRIRDFNSKRDSPSKASRK